MSIVCVKMWTSDYIRHFVEQDWYSEGDGQRSKSMLLAIQHPPWRMRTKELHSTVPRAFWSLCCRCGIRSPKSAIHRKTERISNRNVRQWRLELSTGVCRRIAGLHQSGNVRLRPIHWRRSIKSFNQYNNVNIEETLQEHSSDSAANERLPGRYTVGTLVSLYRLETKSSSDGPFKWWLTIVDFVQIRRLLLRSGYDPRPSGHQLPQFRVDGKLRHASQLGTSCRLRTSTDEKSCGAFRQRLQVYIHLIDSIYWLIFRIQKSRGSCWFIEWIDPIFGRTMGRCYSAEYWEIGAKRRSWPIWITSGVKDSTYCRRTHSLQSITMKSDSCLKIGRQPMTTVCLGYRMIRWPFTLGTK